MEDCGVSGLYLLLVLGIWAGLTALIVKGWRRLLSRDDVPKRRTHAVFVPLLACWLGMTFWYGGGRKVYYDAEVNRMCREDGGVKVYETVRLPAAEYDRLAKKNWVLPDAKSAQPTDSYFTTTETRYFRSSNPQVARTVIQFIRRSDGNVVGEYISYGRGGGDLPGPWHGSSYLCPDPTKAPGVELQIFVRGE